MKRISYIVNPKGTRSDVVARKEARILRQVDQAIACIEDQASEAHENIENLIDSLGEAGSSADTAKLQEKLNKYCELCDKEETAIRYISYLKHLSKTLDQEVEVEIEPTHVVIDK